MKHVMLFCSIILLLAISQAALYLFPIIGIIFTFILLVVFLFLAMYDIYDLAAQEVFAYASVFPLFSLFSFALPWFSGFSRSLIFYFALLLISELFYSFLPQKKHIYHAKDIIYLPLFVFFGVLLGIIAAIITNTFQLPSAPPFFLSLILILIISISEAIYFQGLIQNAATYLTDPILGIIFTLLMYGFFHANPHPVYFVMLLVYSLISILLYTRFKNIYLVMLFTFSLQTIFFFFTHSLLLS